jgi:hypothetical protein
VHRRDLLPVELGVVVLVEQEQLHDPGAKRETPRSCPASTGSMTWMISDAGTRTVSPARPGSVTSPGWRRRK